MADDWFMDVLKVALATAGSRTNLCQKLGCSPSMVASWLNGGKPSLKYIPALIEAAGGDFDRAMPDYRQAPQQPTSVAQIPVLGQVSAGTYEPAGEDDRSIELDESLWSTSPAWKFTTGNVLALEISGESMEPTYKSGDIVLVRKVIAVPPLGTNVVITGPSSVAETYGSAPPSGWSFKKLLRLGDGGFAGAPLNPEFPIVIISQPEQIRFAEVGHISRGGRELPRVSNGLPPGVQKGVANLKSRKQSVARS